MSLLDHGPHSVTVYPEETVTDSYGNPVRRPSDVGVVVVGCMMTPQQANRDATRLQTSTRGQRSDNTYRFRARSAPLGAWSRVVWHDGTRERSFTVLEGPLLYDPSSATRHVAATLHEET